MTARSRLLLTAILVSILAVPAVAAPIGPATKFSGFLCAIDLAENGLPVPPALVAKGGKAITGDTEKLGANGTQGGNIRLTCRATITGWAGGNVNLQGVPCLISGVQCNVNRDLSADLSSLKIDTAGNAVLFCQSKANSRT